MKGSLNPCYPSTVVILRCRYRATWVPGRFLGSTGAPRLAVSRIVTVADLFGRLEELHQAVWGACGDLM